MPRWPGKWTSSAEMVQPYSVLATVYDDGWHEYSDYIYQLIRQVESESRRVFTRICDVACGTGLLLQALLNDEVTRKVCGFDISPEMLKRAGERLPGVTLRQADLTVDFPFSGPFDLITSVYDSLNYVHSPEELELFFRRVRGVTADQGLLMLDVNTPALYERRTGTSIPRLIDGIPFRQRLTYDKGPPPEAVTVFSFPEGTEVHRQRPWSVDEMEDILLRSGWNVLDTLDVIDEDDDEPSGKVVFLAVLR